MIWKSLTVAALLATTAFPNPGMECAPLSDQNHDETVPSCDLDLPTGTERPDKAVWHSDTGVGVVGTAGHEADRVPIHGHSGCLVLLKESFLPVPVRFDLTQSACPEIEDLEWKPGVVLEGRVQGENGEPVRATAQLEPDALEEGGELPNLSGDSCREAYAHAGITFAASDADGRFVLGPVPAGRITVTAQATGYRAESRLVVVARDVSSQEVRAIVLREAAELEILVDRTHVVEELPYSLTVQQGNLEEATSVSDEWIDVATVQIADDGPHAFTLGTGLHRAVLEKDESDLFVVQNTFLSRGYNHLVLTPKPILVSGVVSRAEEPMAGATVSASCLGNETTAETDEDGFYELGLWNAAACAVFTTTPDGSRFADKLDLRHSAPGDEVKLDVEVPSGKITGVVVAVATGDPIEGARVNVTQRLASSVTQTSFGTETDHEGRFEFTGARTGSDVADTTVTADKEAFQPESVVVDLTGDSEPAEIRIELDSSIRVSGRVVGPAGSPVPGAFVGCCPHTRAGALTASTTTNAAGEFTIDGWPGALVYATAPGYRIGWAVSRIDDAETTITLDARSQPSVIQLVNDEGPVARAAVTYASHSSGVIPHDIIFKDAIFNGQQWMSDEDGQVATSNLPDGFYSVLHVSPGAVREIGQLVIPTPGVTTVSITP